MATPKVPTQALPQIMPDDRHPVIRRNASHPLADQRPQPPSALPLKLRHPRSAACRCLRSDGTGQLPNDLAGSANDMAIWLAARSIRGAQRQLPHCGVTQRRRSPADPASTALAASAEAPEDAIVTYGFGELFPIHVREVQIVLDGPQLGDDDAERWPAMEEIHHQRHLTWGPATRLHHLTGGDPAPCLVAGE